MKFLEALNETIKNGTCIRDKKWKDKVCLKYICNRFVFYNEALDFNIFSGNILYLLNTSDWEIVEEEKKPSEKFLIKEKGLNSISYKELGEVLDKMYKDIKKLKEK